MKKLNRRELKHIGQVITVLLVSISLILLAMLIALPYISLLPSDCGNIYGPNGTFVIDSDSDFIKLLSHSSVYSINQLDYKTEYKLKGNIEINVADLPDEPKNFKGILDGQGHSLTIVGDDINKTLSRPIFSTIEEGSVITRIDLELENLTLSGEEDPLKSNIALLAGTNNGTINNCTVTIPKIKIGKCPNTAGLVNSNYGDIHNVCMKVDKVTSDVAKENWKSRFGAVATANHKLIKNIVLDMSFSASNNVPSVLVGQTINQYVGYIKGSFTDSSDISESNIYIFTEDTTYMLRAVDSKSGYEHKSPNTDLLSFKNDDFERIFNNGAKEADDYWEFDDWDVKQSCFPKLK